MAMKALHKIESWQNDWLLKEIARQSPILSIAEKKSQRLLSNLWLSTGNYFAALYNSETLFQFTTFQKAAM